MSEQDNHSDQFHDPEWVSRSARKRESHASQDLAKRLFDLNAADLATIPLDDSFLEGLELARKIRNKREAFRRQMQYLGKLMRNADEEAVRAALHLLDTRDARMNHEFHKLELWRDRLLEQGDAAIQPLLDSYPAADRQRLRQLVRQAQKEQEKGEKKSARALFKYLRELAGA